MARTSTIDTRALDDIARRAEELASQAPPLSTSQAMLLRSVIARSDRPAL